MRNVNLFAGLLVAAAAATFIIGQSWGAADPSGPMKDKKDNTIEFKLTKMDPKIIKKITDALPDAAPATPLKPRKLLIYTRACGFVHDSIPYGATALKLMGEKTKAYESTITDDAAAFEPDNLKQYDAMFFVSTTGECFDMDNRVKLESRPPEEQVATKRRREALINFVKSGKGFGGLHAAIDSNRTWPDYQEMIGGVFMHHPFGNINLRLDDPNSPITAMLDAKGFNFSDEIYVMDPASPYSRAKNHILLSINPSDPGKGTDLAKGKRPDNDFALSWIKKYGEGRVFFCAFGHYNEVFEKPLIMKHYLAGIQYTMGDLKADDAPSGNAATAPAPVPTPATK